jgi:group I intron endonuclease
MKSGIYAIRNMINDKIYIGQAVIISKRWKNHRVEFRLDRHANPYLQAAYNKHGKFNLAFYVIEFCAQSELDVREQFYMDLYNSYDREYGYNLSPTAGGSNTGHKHSDETKAAWSAQRKGKVRVGEALEALRAGAVKRKLTYVVSDKTKNLLSESHKGIIPSQETRAKRGVSMTGNQNSAGSKRDPAHLAALAEGRRKAKQKRDEEFARNFVGTVLTTSEF